MLEEELLEQPGVTVGQVLAAEAKLGESERPILGTELLAMRRFVERKGVADKEVDGFSRGFDLAFEGDASPSTNVSMRTL